MTIEKKETSARRCKVVRTVQNTSCSPREETKILFSKCFRIFQGAKEQRVSYSSVKYLPHIHITQRKE